ncbi:hypothetical protein M9H77_34248 [Catharanthus roseus]|uniref:Uncharacterized protein n=1 Tax=Catharanthus roseus TaxID=4058 RepID=A0ACB9ZKY3_CATRO|nr:hypothetical protein M9H77_34248 [Catharanthus roseus]
MNVLSSVDVEDLNCDVFNSSPSFFVLNAVVIEIPNKDSLVGTIISSKEDAFRLYNDNAFRLGFSIRKGNQKFKTGRNTKTNDNAGYLRELKDTEVCIAVGLRVLKKDAYNSLYSNNLDCRDKENEDDLYFDSKAISDKYILKRWTKDIDLRAVSVFVMQGKREMLRKFSDLISASKLNINARQYVEEGFRMMKDKIIAEVGIYYVDNSENESGSSNTKYLVGRRAIGEHSIRKKNIVEIKCNQARGKRKSALTHASMIKRWDMYYNKAGSIL